MIQTTLTEFHSWKGQIYAPGDRLIPDDLAAAIGVMPKAKARAKTKPEAAGSDDPTVIEVPPGASVSDALTLINQAAEASELKPLPGIGEGAAKRLLAHRPDGGYDSLEQVQELCPELAKSPYRVDWGAIALWQPEPGEPD